MKPTQLRRQSPYSATQLYDLVADVARYPEFIPHCTDARIQSITPQENGTSLMYADLIVQYKFLREHYASAVVLDPTAKRISVAQKDGRKGVLRRLNNQWEFIDTSNGCDIIFYLYFEFRVPLLRRAISPLMEKAVPKFLTAFETRADALYGNRLSEARG